MYFSIIFEGGNLDDVTYDILSTSTSNNLKTHFRIVPDENNYYKILTNNNYTSSTANDCYKFYLCGTPDRTVSSEFYPDYTNFYWQIQKY